MDNLIFFLRKKILSKLDNYFSRSFGAKKLRDRTISFFNRKTQGNSSYSIISACYNVEKYIDDFVESLVYQTLDFKKNIQLILVDDGSTDNTLEKIKKWEKRYPNNIIGVTKLHEGVAAARNFGIKFAKNDWVTFADSDDFFDCYAVEKVDEISAYSKQQNIGFISLNVIFFYENKNRFSNAHPLRYKYFFPLTVRKIKHLDDYIQILCNSVFIRKELLKDFRFSNLIKPSFEDGFFINTLFLENEEKSICFLKEAKYFHRKRQNLSSLTDKYWEVEERYKDCLQFGSLRLLDLSTNGNRRVPPPLVYPTFNSL